MSEEHRQQFLLMNRLVGWLFEKQGSKGFSPSSILEVLALLQALVEWRYASDGADKQKIAGLLNLLDENASYPEMDDSMKISLRDLAQALNKEFDFVEHGLGP